MQTLTRRFFLLGSTALVTAAWTRGNGGGGATNVVDDFAVLVVDDFGVQVVTS